MTNNKKFEQYEPDFVIAGRPGEQVIWIKAVEPVGVKRLMEDLKGLSFVKRVLVDQRHTVDYFTLLCSDDTEQADFDRINQVLQQAINRLPESRRKEVVVALWEA